MFNKLWSEKEMRILILGLDGAGKTTILYRLQVGEVVTTIPSTWVVRPWRLGRDARADDLVPSWNLTLRGCRWDYACARALARACPPGRRL